MNGKMKSMFILINCLMIDANSEQDEKLELSNTIKQLVIDTNQMKTAMKLIQHDVKSLKLENKELRRVVTLLSKKGPQNSYARTDTDSYKSAVPTSIESHKRFLIQTVETTKMPHQTFSSTPSTPLSTSDSTIKIPTIAFSASLNKHIDWTHPEGSFLAIFDDVTTNDARTYDPYTGLFTSPAKGTYYFYTSLKCDHSFVSEISFVKNNDIVYGWDKGADDSGSAAIVMNLDVDDNVHVQHYLWRKDYSYVPYAASFLGFKIS